jgi:hypothetical protein
MAIDAAAAGLGVAISRGAQVADAFWSLTMLARQPNARFNYRRRSQRSV